MKEIAFIGETMTVLELITALSKYPQDLPVITEGCDCYGNCVGIKRLDEGKKEDCLILERNN
jgi:hypothetical protein